MEKGGLNPIVSFDRLLEPFPQGVYNILSPLAFERGQQLSDAPGLARILASQQLFYQCGARIGDFAQRAGGDVAPAIVRIAQLLDQRAHRCRRADVAHFSQGEFLHVGVRTLHQFGEQRAGIVGQIMGVE